MPIMSVYNGLNNSLMLKLFEPVAIFSRAIRCNILLQTDAMHYLCTFDNSNKDPYLHFEREYVI